MLKKEENKGKEKKKRGQDKSSVSFGVSVLSTSAFAG